MLEYHNNSIGVMIGIVRENIHQITVKYNIVCMSIAE